LFKISNLVLGGRAIVTRL